jgi:hypothetical protein
MQRVFLVVLVIICNVAMAVPPEEKFLCRKDEQVIFGCNLGKKVLSLCASSGPFSAPPAFQYRFGTLGHLELQFPDTPGPAKDHFWFSSTAYSGGGAAHIRFVNADYEYVLFDSTVRTNFSKKGQHDPKFDAGVLIRHQGKFVSLRHCANDAAIHAMAYQQIPQEEFQYYDEIP